jgi:hypothetical protein
MPLDVTAKTFRVNYDTAEPTFDWSSANGLPRPDFQAQAHNRMLCDYISDWLATNQISKIEEIYHNPYPVGFVCRWIERAEEAEARVRELEHKLVG